MTAPINKPDHKGLTHVFKAVIYSWQGLKAAAKYEEAFRLELMGLVVMLPLGIWLGQNGVERALLVGSLILVLAFELFNSAIEAVVDRIGVEHHVLSGRAKDLGSAVVMVSLFNVAIIWGFILYDRFCN